MEDIDPRRLLVKIAEALEGLKIPYIVTGGMAVFIWGRPRFTADIDIVIKMHKSDAGNLVKALKGLSDSVYIDEDEIEQALNSRGEFNFIDGISGLKVDFWVADEDEFGRCQMRRRQSKKILNKGIYFVSPEDLILNKFIWHKMGESVKQLEDIESILAIQKKLDLRYIRKWAKRQSTLGIFKTLLQKL